MMKGEQAVCPGCGYPKHAGAHGPNCAYGGARIKEVLKADGDAEVKKDAPPSPEATRQYSQELIQYYSARAAELRTAAGNDAERKKFDNYNDQMKGELMQLTRDNALEALRESPEMAVVPLADLAGALARHRKDDFFNGEKYDEDPGSAEIRKKDKERADKERKLLRDSYERLFPSKMRPLSLDRPASFKSDVLRIAQELSRHESFAFIGATLKLLTREDVDYFNPRDNLMVKEQLFFAMNSIGETLGEMAELWVAEQDDEVTEDERKAWMAAARIFYKLDGSAERLEQSARAWNASFDAKPAASERPAVSRPEKVLEAKQPAPEKPTMAYKDAAELLNKSDVRTVEDIQRLVTPEVKQAILDGILADIDRRIPIAKQDRARGRVLGIDTMGRLIGIRAGTKEYGFPYIAGTGKAVGGESDIRMMKVVDYLKGAFNYDLRKDEKRHKDLEENTNMFW